MIEALQQRVSALYADMEVIKNRLGWTLIIGIVSLAVHIAFKAAERQSAAAGSGTVTAGAQSVTVGAVAPAAVKEPQRNWLTTGEVAERERVAPRTVLSWIESGEIPAERERDAREWRIPADYQRGGARLRLSAAEGGN